jgi:hypothetical protein
LRINFVENKNQPDMAKTVQTADCLAASAPRLKDQLSPRRGRQSRLARHAKLPAKAASHLAYRPH